MADESAHRTQVGRFWQSMNRSTIHLRELQRKFSEAAASHEGTAASFAAEVVDKISLIHRIAKQLDENPDTYPPIAFQPGQLLQELQALIETKEKLLMETKTNRASTQKIQLCEAFLHGTCSKGVTCSFSHSASSLELWVEKWLAADRATSDMPNSLQINEPFGAEAWVSIFHMIAQGNFWKLILRSCDRNALDVLVQAMRSNDIPSVTVLDLARNNLCDVYPRGVLRLSRALNERSHVSSLFLGANALGAAGCLAICQATSQQIRVLNLESNGISFADPAFRMFAETLGECGEMQKLSLASNDLGPEGAKQIVASLMKLPELSYLDLFSVRMGDEGAAALVDLVKDHEKLQFLNISWNGLTIESVTPLSVALAKHPALEVLKLHYNAAIGRRLGSTMADIIKSNTELRSIDLRWTGLSDDGVISIADALSSAESMVCAVYVAGNDLDSKTEGLLDKILRKKQASKGYEWKLDWSMGA